MLSSFIFLSKKKNTEHLQLKLKIYKHSWVSCCSTEISYDLSKKFSNLLHASTKLYKVIRRTDRLDHCFENKIENKFTVKFELLTQFTNEYIIDEKNEELHEFLYAYIFNKDNYNSNIFLHRYCSRRINHKYSLSGVSKQGRSTVKVGFIVVSFSKLHFLWKSTKSHLIKKNHLI